MNVKNWKDRLKIDLEYPFIFKRKITYINLGLGSQPGCIIYRDIVPTEILYLQRYCTYRDVVPTEILYLQKSPC